MTGTNPAAEAAVSSALLHVLREQGWEVAAQPDRLRAMLADVLAATAHEHRAAIDALVLGAEEGVGRALAAVDGPARAAQLAQLPAALIAWGLDPVQARWAVQTWDWALRAVNPARTDLPPAGPPSPAGSPSSAGAQPPFRPAAAVPPASSPRPSSAPVPSTPTVLPAPAVSWPVASWSAPTGPGGPVRPTAPVRRIHPAVLAGIGVAVLVIGLVAVVTLTRRSGDAADGVRTPVSQTLDPPGGPSGGSGSGSGSGTGTAPTAEDSSTTYAPQVYAGQWAVAHVRAQAHGDWDEIVISEHSVGLADVHTENGDIYWTPQSNGERPGLWITWYAKNSKTGRTSELAKLSIHLQCNPDYRCYGG